MLGGEYYAIIVMDSWTWAYTDHYGQVAIRPLLKGRENATFILDFFGFKPLKQAGQGGAEGAEQEHPHSLPGLPAPASSTWPSGPVESQQVV